MADKGSRAMFFFPQDWHHTEQCDRRLKKNKESLVEDGLNNLDEKERQMRF